MVKSEWLLEVVDEGSRRPTIENLNQNLGRWIPNVFGPVRAARIEEATKGWRIMVAATEAPAEDEEYFKFVAKSFKVFVEAGWGPLAIAAVSVVVLDGLMEGKKMEVIH